MARITANMIMAANDQAYAAVSEARKGGAAFTLVDIRYGRGIAFIDGARSFENARQFA